MARFKNDVNGGWLFEQAVRMFNNFAKNWAEEVQDEDFFDLFGTSYGSSEAEAIRYAEKYCGVDEKTRWAGICCEYEGEETDGGKKKRMLVEKSLRGSIATFIKDIWNHKPLRGKCRAMLAAWSQALLKRVRRRRKGQDALQRRIDDIAELLKLSDLERELVIWAAVRALTVFDDYPVSEEVMNPAVFAAMATDQPSSAVEKALGGEGRLSKYGVLAPNGDFIATRPGRRPWEGGGGSNPYCRYLQSGDGGMLEGRFYKKGALDETLPWSYYGKLAEEHGGLLKELISAAKGKRGANILFYGAPGTGKTSFARTLAKELGLDLYEIRQGDRSGEDDSAQNRLAGIRLCNDRVPEGRSLMMVDEADQLLRTARMELPFLFGLNGIGGASEKGVINSILDETKVPAIWISNAPPNVMDDSVRRRFDYSVRFEKLNTKQRQAIWRNNVDKLGLGEVVGEELAGRLAGRYQTSAGGITMVLENVKRMRKAGDDVEKLIDRLMRPHCELMGVPKPDECLAPTSDYSLEGLNMTGDIALSSIVEAVRNFRATKDDGCDPDRPRMNLLLWGPPGTGKTEFVKHLGKELDTKVHVKMGSDLLSMWVGGTEKNIREAFRQAEEENAVLFLDEIDGLVQDRTGARRSWEVTQVNELLHQMENFKSVMVAATNFMDNLDQAILRRFTFKLQFDYLDEAGKRLFFEWMFKVPLTEEEGRRLAAIPNLAPGDFRTVRQGMYYLGGNASNAQRLGELEKESALKKATKRVAARIGF